MQKEFGINDIMYLKKNKTIAKEYIPPILLKILKTKKNKYGWHGDYESWNEAKANSKGYDDNEIFNKTFRSLLKVKNGEAIYERDSVLFDEIQYSFPVLAGLMWIAASNNGILNIIDFGGSLGSTYFQNRKFLKNLKFLRWNIIEQKKYIRTGKEYFETENLKFYNTIEDCMKIENPNTILFSGVLQYLEKPYKLIESIINMDFVYIIIDRTGFINYGSDDLLTVQKVHPNIYKASYPCYFFNKSKFINYFLDKYTLITEYNSIDKYNIPAKSKGFIFKKK